MINEEMTPQQKDKAEEIVMALKKHTDEFKQRYGERWKSVLYAISNKQAQKKG